MKKKENRTIERENKIKVLNAGKKIKKSLIYIKN
jgi:hypothetical protein